MAVDAERAVVVWCPDWPAVAGARQLGRPTDEPAAVLHANRVVACTSAARKEGIRTGQRKREAQSRCPELLLLAADPDRDARLFEPVAAALESIVPGVEILRPGLIAGSVRGPARYFGSEAAAAERITDVVEALDVECQVGAADSLEVAVLAARQSRLIPPGGSAQFCAPLPVAALAQDPAISPPERKALIDLLIRLGLITVGSFAQLPERSVITRFGADGLAAHRLARGAPERGLSRRVIPEELVVEQACDPPVERVDTAAFLARALAERFHQRLAGAGLACTRLAISAGTDQGAVLSRVWRCARPLTAAATADRLRWQLDGWLTAGRTVTAGSGAEDGVGPGALIWLRLEPVEAIGAGLIQYGLWGSDGEQDQKAGWAFARVQGLLGPQAVLTAVPSGGRGPAERITLVPWGEEKAPARDPAAPWPGALPAPSPASLTDPEPVRLLDARGDEVEVDDRGALTGVPAVLLRAAELPDLVQEWAGPWALDERWWAPTGQHVPAAVAVPVPVRAGPRRYAPAPGDLDYRKPPPRHSDVIPDWLAGTRVRAPARYRARLQLLTDTAGWLLRFGPAGWELEGTYD